MTLVRPDLTFDRAAVMRLAHLEYRSAGAGKRFGECLSYAWRIAKKLRAAVAAQPDDRRLLNMRAHRTAALRARARRWSLHPSAIALAGRGSIEVAR